MNKNYITKNNNIISLNITEGYCTKIISIDKIFTKQLKDITLMVWDDFSFKGYFSHKNIYSKINTLTFSFSLEDKIYFALNRLLGQDDYLLIDDDNTKDNLVNYLEIIRKGNNIIFKIHDNEIAKLIINRFNIFIKNIGPDPRSKEDSNTKYRLYTFFLESQEILINEYHQYTFDEYYELIKNKQEKNLFLNNYNVLNRKKCQK